mmetsp:Transcript_126349/g.365742  ORF Transcript_126349/g.365742 Transcript_126349/m.365742 type:complete len:1077 (+) Transcript_126349:55-3285(+)
MMQWSCARGQDKVGETHGPLSAQSTDEDVQALCGSRRFYQLLVQAMQEFEKLEAECTSLREQCRSPPEAPFPPNPSPAASGDVGALAAILPAPVVEGDQCHSARAAAAEPLVSGDGVIDDGVAFRGVVATCCSDDVIDDMLASENSDASLPGFGVVDQSFAAVDSESRRRRPSNSSLITIGEVEEATLNFDTCSGNAGGFTSFAGQDDAAARPGFELDVETRQWLDDQSTKNLGASEPDCGIISPLSKTRVAWEILWCCMLCFEVWLIPFQVFFYPGTLPESLSVMATLSTIFFFGDIVVNFNTGFIDLESKVMVMNRRSVTRRYVRGWLFFDFVATFPWELVDSMGAVSTVRAVKASKLSKGLRILRSLKLLRVLKFVRTAKVIKHRKTFSLIEAITLNRSALQKTSLEKAADLFGPILDHCQLPLQVFVCLALLAHLFATIRGAVHPSQYLASIFSQGLTGYSECFTWAYKELTFGSVDTSPPMDVSTLELVLLTIRGLLVGLAVSRIVFTAIVFFQHQAAFHIHSRAAAVYLKMRGVGAETQLAVLRHLDSTARAWHLQDDFKRVMHSYLPAELRRTVQEEMWVPRLMSLGLIRQVASWNDLFINQLAELANEELFASHAVLFKPGDIAHAAYHIIEGEVLARAKGFANDNAPPFTTGMWLGEKSLIGSGLRRATLALTRSNCTMLAVPAAGFGSLLDSHNLTERFQEFCANQLWRGLCGRCGLLGDHFGDECPLIPGQWNGGRRWSLHRIFNRSASPKNNMMSASSSAVDLPVSRLGRDLRLFLRRQDLDWLEPELLSLQIFSLEQLKQVDLAELKETLSRTGQSFTQEEQDSISPEAISAFLATVAMEFKSRVREAQHFQGYILFLSHYKVEAGTEAALMRTELEQILGESTGSSENSVFLDSEDLTTLAHLQDAVRKSRNVALLLTANVLTRPWVLVELATAHAEGIPVLPVALAKEGNAFAFPDQAFFDSLLDGSLLGEVGSGVITDCGFTMETVVEALRQVLKRIALPYSPHRPASIRRAELSALIQQCTLQDTKTKNRSKEKGSAGLIRAKRLKRSDTWVSSLLTTG